jgi:hypothetical protein
VALFCQKSEKNHVSIMKNIKGRNTRDIIQNLTFKGAIMYDLTLLEETLDKLSECFINIIQEPPYAFEGNLSNEIEVSQYFDSAETFVWEIWDYCLSIYPLFSN